MHRFETSYRRHLAAEQRRAVLHALKAKLDPDVTMGDVLDAADALGFGDQLGEMSLQDLADALLTPTEQAANTAGGEARPLALEDDDDDDDEPIVVAKSSGKNGAKPKVSPKTSKKASPKTSKKAKPARKDPTPAKKARKPIKKRAQGARLRALKKKIGADERMNIEEAAELFVPVIEEMGQATMQDLEDFSGVGRRKLRFHVGQLVREEYLARHGMGRGTYYTVG